MLKSLNQLRNEFKALVEAMHMPKSFYWGEWQDAISDSEIQYPLVIVTVTSANLQENIVGVTMTITVADKVYDDRSNVDDVESDNLKILRDINNAFYSKRWRSFLVGQLNQNGAATRFRFETDDVVDGWYASFTLNIAANRSICDIPIDDAYDWDENLRPTCAPCELVVNGYYKIEISSGQTYNFNVVSTKGNIIGSWSGTNWLVPDAQVEVKNTIGTLLSTIGIPAGATDDVIAPDGSVEVNGGAFGVVPSGAALNIPVKYNDSTAVGTVSGGAVIVPDNRYNTSLPIQTGRTQSAHPNDDGAKQRGRLLNWTNLKFNNYFGHTARFTGITGGYHNGNNYVNINGIPVAKSAAFPNDIVIDWSQWDVVTGQVIWWKFTPQAAKNWNDTLNGIPYAHAGYNDWVVPNYPHEALSILSFEINSSFPSSNAQGSWLNYPPFDRTTNDERFWTITEQPENSQRAFAIRSAISGVITLLKTDLVTFFIIRYGNTSEL